jgi:hypothetical protein
MPNDSGFGIKFLLKKLGMKTVNPILLEFIYSLFVQHLFLSARKN